MKKNRIMAMTLAVLTLSGGSFAGTGIAFQDIADIKEKAAILSLQERGIVNGTSVDKFSPARGLLASEGVQLIVNAFNLNLDLIRFIKAPKATDYFKLADDEAWYADGFIKATVNGVDLPGDLNPNATWTKEEFVYRLVTFLEVKNEMPLIKISPVEIKDDMEITPEYSGLLQRAIHYGLIELDAEGNLNPKQEITRAEAASILYKTLEFAVTDL